MLESMKTILNFITQKIESPEMDALTAEMDRINTIKLTEAQTTEIEEIKERMQAAITEAEDMMVEYIMASMDDMQVSARHSVSHYVDAMAYVIGDNVLFKLDERAAPRRELLMKLTKEVLESEDARALAKHMKTTDPAPTDSTGRKLS